MKKKLKLYGFIFIILSVVFFLFLKFYPIPQKNTFLYRTKLVLFDENPITVTGDGVKLNDDAIRVSWQTDFTKETIIWENGEQQTSINNEYGNHIFKVYYYDSLVGQVVHLRTNNWHAHHFHFHLHYLNVDHDIGFDFMADGNNGYEETDISTY